MTLYVKSIAWCVLENVVPLVQELDVDSEEDDNVS